MSVELTSKTIDELQEELIALAERRFKLRMARGVGQAFKPHEFKEVRRQIARVKTIIREKRESK